LAHITFLKGKEDRMSDLSNDYRRLEAEARKQLAQQGKKLLVVEYRSRPGRAYMFKAAKGFAWVHLKTRLDCLRVGAKKDRVVEAGISYDFEKPNSAFNSPGAHWDISEGDSLKLMQVARYLAQLPDG
jgi:hypothetical protein